MFLAELLRKQKFLGIHIMLRDLLKKKNLIKKISNLNWKFKLKIKNLKKKLKFFLFFWKVFSNEYCQKWDLKQNRKIQFGQFLPILWAKNHVLKKVGLAKLLRKQKFIGSHIMLSDFLTQIWSKFGSTSPSAWRLT
jgi:hypothetical protein